MTSTAPHMINNPVTHKGVLAKAAQAGVTLEITVDGLGRYHIGIVILETNAKYWTLTSDTGQRHARTMVQAFRIAQQINDERTALLATLRAMSDDALQALVLDPAADYMAVQYAMHLLYTERGWKTLQVRR